MKRILLLTTFVLINGLSWAQTVIIGPEPFTSSLGIFNSTTWTDATPSTNSSYTGASGGKVAAILDDPGYNSGDQLTLTSSFSTLGKTSITLKFSEWVDDNSFAVADIGIEYSFDNASWTDAGFSSLASTSTNTTLRSFPLTAIDNSSTVYLRFITKNAGLGTGASYFIDDFSVEGTSGFTNYYNISGQPLTSITSWGINTNGSGANPSNFSSANQVFNVINGTTASVSSAWTVSGSGSKVVIGDGSNAITLSATSNITAPVDINNLGTLELKATSITPGVTFGTLANGSTVVYGRTTNGNQNIKAGTYSHLQFSGLGTRTFPASNITINGTLNVGSGISVALAAGFSLTLKGSVTGTSTFSGNTTSSLIIDKSGGGAVGTLYFNSGSQTLNSLVISNGTLGIGSNFTLGGTNPLISIASTGALDAGTYEITRATSSGTMEVYGTLLTAHVNGLNAISPATATFIIASESDAPSLKPGCTIEYNSASPQTITPYPDVNAYQILKLSGGATKSFSAASYSIKGDFIVNSGTPVSLNASSTINFSGTGAQNVAGLTFPTVEFSGSGNKTLVVSGLDTTKISSLLTVSGTAKLVTGDKLVLLSATGTNVAMYLDKTSYTTPGGAIDGKLTVERMVTTSRSGVSRPNGFPILLSSPVSGTLGTLFQNDWQNFYYYVPTNTSGQRYVRVNISDAANDGAGYLLRALGGRKYYFNGVPNNGDIVEPLIFGGDNYNLIGNPYPTTINWNTTDITMTSIGSSQQFKVYDGSGYVVKGLGENIPLGQGFFVLASASDASVEFHNSARVNNQNSLYRLEAAYSNRSELWINRGPHWHDMAVIWGQSGVKSDSFDLRYDGKKIFPDLQAPSVYFPKDTNKTDVFTFGLNEESVSVPVKIGLPLDTIYKLNFKDRNLVDAVYNIYLIDSVQHATQDLRDNDTYSFTGSPSNLPKMSVLFTKSVLTGLSDYDSYEANLSVYSEKGFAYFNSSDIPSQVIINNVNGIQVFSSSSINGKNFDLDLSATTSGVYIATLQLGNRVVHKKFILNKE